MKRAYNKEKNTLNCFEKKAKMRPFMNLKVPWKNLGRNDNFFAWVLREVRENTCDLSTHLLLCF